VCRPPEKASEWLIARNPARVRAVLADPDSWYDFYVIDFKRRIAATYGLASSDNIHEARHGIPQATEISECGSAMFISLGGFALGRP
jgi:hypothetical protein